MSVMSNLLTVFYAWGGSSVADILQDWEYMGVFEFVVPFLLVFAVVFGILVKSQIIGEYRGINMVIALAVALLSITSPGFRSFFRVLFPYAGIGIAILLVGLILTGLFFTSQERWWRITFFSIAMVIAVIVVLSALSSYETFLWGAWWWREYLNAIIVGIVVIGLIVLIVLAAKGQQNTIKTT